MDSRGLSAVVEKLLVAGVVLLFVSGLTVPLVGDVVPRYRAATADELADRVVARAANAIERSLPGVEGAVTVRTAFVIPATLAGTGYTLELRHGGVTIVHPNPAIGAKAGLGIPEGYRIESGTVESAGTLAVLVRGRAGNRTVSLMEGN